MSLYFQVENVLLEVAETYRIPLEDRSEAADAAVASQKKQMICQSEPASPAQEYLGAYTAQNDGVPLGIKMRNTGQFF